MDTIRTLTSKYLLSIDPGSIRFKNHVYLSRGSLLKHELHTHEYMELVYLLDGRVEVDTCVETIALLPYNLIIYPEGLAHREISDHKNPHEIISIRVETGSVPPLSHSIQISDKNGRLRWLLEQVSREARGKEGEDSPELINAYLKAAFLLILRFYKESVDKNDDIVAWAVQYFSENYKEDINISELIARRYLSLPYFDRLFKKKMGVSPVKYLHMVRVNVARSLLLNENIPVKYVAEASGFRDNHYFSRVFKRIEGVSPGAYRAQKLADNKKY